MRYKRFMIILVLAVFALSVAGVCASDADTALESSADDSIIEVDDVQAIGENENEEIVSEGNVGTFSDLRQKIQDAGDDNTITLDRDYKYSADDSAFNEGIIIDRDLNVYGNGHTINGSNQARIFKINSGNVVFHNITFTNGNVCGDFGGAILGECTAVNCIFINNQAGQGGAMYGGSAINCTVTGNSAERDGGAMYGGSAVNCTFTGNQAESEGGAMFLASAINCTFTDNKASYSGAMYGGSAINCTFTGNKASYGGAMFLASAVNCTFTGNQAEYRGGAIYRGSAINCTFTGNSAKWDGGAMCEGYYLECIGQEEGDYHNCDKLNLTFVAFDFTSTYKSNKEFYIVLRGQNGIIEFINTDVVIYKDGVGEVMRYSCLSGDTVIFDLAAGIYTAELIITYPNLDPKPKNITLTINQATPTITAAGMTTTYNINKDLVITLTGIEGNPLAGEKITVDLNGAKTYTTDKNGQVKVPTLALAPNTYTAAITFEGNAIYTKMTKSVKITVNKATPKLTAKAKTFKTSVKTKKYTITLKDKTGKAIKNAKVTLKVKGETYKATTNSKGKATFKITKLNKKGTYKATITFKGDKYYKKVTKKAKIKVIVSFKTVSKGSKDKSIVKQIQQALKDKGYYLSYKGHYLMVDGKFKSCTFRSVKEFQKDKHLKVTGKVDEKTAKKLGII